MKSIITDNKEFAPKGSSSTLLDALAMIEKYLYRQNVQIIEEKTFGKYPLYILNTNVYILKKSKRYIIGFIFETN